MPKPARTAVFPSVSWIPRNTDARLKIFRGRIIVEGTVGADRPASCCTRSAVIERLNFLIRRWPRSDR